MSPEISIIIPAFNEAAAIEKALQQIASFTTEYKLEIIVADGGSEDNTVAIAKKYATVIAAEKGKAKQLNAGAAIAKGAVYFFVHADMQVPSEAYLAIHYAIYEKGFDGGGFDNVFDVQNDKIKFISKAIFLSFFEGNGVPEKVNPILYGDNGIFIKAAVFKKLRGFKDIPIMEDYDLSKRLMKNYKSIKLYQPKLFVSSRRLLKNGIVKTVFTWLIVQKLYKAGVSPCFLAKRYKDIR